MLVLECGSTVVVLVDVIGGEVETQSGLDDMLAAKLEARVGQVIPECGSPLGEFLDRSRAPDLEAACIGIDVETMRKSRRIGTGSPVEVLVAQQGFVEPCTLEIVVSELGRSVVVVDVVRCLEGGVAPKVTDVSLVAMTEAELGRRILAHLVGQLAEKKRLPER
jgi:hypothetical protein